MAAGLRVLIYSSCAAVVAGIESTLGEGRTGAGHLLVPAHRYSDLASRADEVEPHVAVLHGLDRCQIGSWGRRGRTAAVLAVADDWSGPDILHAIRAGVLGLVSIDSDLPALGPACEDAALGRPYLSPALLLTLLAYLSGKEDPERSTRLGLTAREMQVLRHLAVGRSQSDISGVMRISNRTVKHHLGNVYRKLGVHSQTEAIVLAYRDGLVV
jgi:DNA-binding NarL/FixJ family response regulator